MEPVSELIHPDTQSPSPRARDRILDAAYELFSRNGIQAVGIDAVISRSGVARQTLYRHFTSKQDLVLAWHLLRAAQEQGRRRRIDPIGSLRLMR